MDKLNKKLKKEIFMLSNEQIIKFQKLYENRFGKKISREDAYEGGAKLVRLLELIYKPMTKDEYKLVEKRREETKDKTN